MLRTHNCGELNLSNNGQEVTIKTKDFDNFEEKYFRYFVDTYEKNQKQMINKKVDSVQEIVDLKVKT